MPEWADVYVTNFDERTNLNDKALFFIPSARLALVELGITTAALAGHARNASDVRGAGIILGLQAITKIMNCVPSTYASAKNFVVAANSILEKEGHTKKFNKSDIVACVFRFKDYSATLKACDVNSNQIADACKIKREIVRSLEGSNYRVSLAHAFAIRNHLCELAEQHGVELPDFKTPEGCITAYSRTGDTVALLKEPKADSKDPDIYYYQRDDLNKAPPKGHAWAIL